MTNKAARVVSVWTLLGAWAVVGWGSAAWGQFKCGNVFVAESSNRFCHEPPDYSPDRIWELNPATGEVKLIAEIPVSDCTFLTGLAFTPDGTRLRASALLRNEIWEFDSEGNWTTVLDASDGIACPWGYNNLAYDAEGNFYVANDCGGNILKFPADGGPGTVFTSGTGSLDALAFAADGDLYFTTILNNSERLMRVTPEGTVTEFDNYGSLTRAAALTSDRSGNIYVALTQGGGLVKYEAGNSASKETIATIACGTQCSMTMSPDQSQIYFHRGGKLFGVNLINGTNTLLANYVTPPFGFTGGIALPPALPCVPVNSHWCWCIVTLVVLAAGTIALGPYRRAMNNPLRVTKTIR